MHKMYDIKILSFLNILCEANGEKHIVEVCVCVCVCVCIYIYIYRGNVILGIT